MPTGSPTLYAVYHTRAADAGRRDPVVTPLLLPVRITDAIAPEIPKATLDFNAAAGDHVWNWANYIGVDDVVIVAAVSTGEVLFSGWISDVQFRFSRSESAVVTACGDAARLDRDLDHLIFGRICKSTGGQWTHYTGLPCRFNADGRPNRTAARASGDGPYGFTADNAAGSQWWTVADAIEYLLVNYNTKETYALNPVIDDLPTTKVIVPDLACDGDSLWSALGRLAEYADLSIYVEPAFAEPAFGGPGQIRIIENGPSMTVSHQAPRRAGGLVALDVRRTNLFAASVSMTTASCVTRPVVAGGVPLYEITVELDQAWDSGDYAVDDAGIIAPGAEAGAKTSQYVTRYCTGGDEHAKYQYVGRLFDANTDGLFDDYNIDITDVALLAGQAAASWPPMPHRPLRMLTGASRMASGSGVERYIEYTLDDGAHWWPLAGGARLLPGRLGVYLSVRNLASIAPPGVSPLTGSIAAVLLTDDADKVRLRLTCSIVGLSRTVVSPPARPTGGTAWPTAAWFDRGSLAQVRTRCSSSRFSSSGIAADETTADATDDDKTAAAKILADEGVQLQDLNERRLIEASMTLEWIAPEYTLGARITRIDGIDVDLSNNAGPAKTHPRIVRRIFRLRPEDYQTDLILDSDREAAVV